MEIPFILILIFSSSFLFLIFCIPSFINKRRFKYSLSLFTSNEKINLPPGRSGWPFIGETMDYFSKVLNGNPEKFLEERKKKYSSKVFGTSLIGEAMAMFPGPEGNKFLFSNENNLVQVWFPKSIDKLFPKSHNNSNHNDFSSARKFLSAPLKGDSLQRFVGVADALMKQLIRDDWDRAQLKVSHSVRKYTFALACRLFLSISDQEQVQKLSHYIEDINRGTLALAIDIPWTTFGRAVKASREMRQDLQEIIRQRKIDLSENKASPTQDILSQMLLATNENGQFSNESDISSYLVGMLHGGYGSLNSALTFMMKYLAEYPDVYHQALQEHLDISKSKGEKELLNWEDLRKMRYSWNVVNEVLRLSPPVFGSFREAISDFQYAGYDIPKGWKLHWMAQETHMNPEYFENPEKFDPSRFEEKVQVPYTYVPFGGGPRMCPGSEYVRMVILVFMHNVVREFRWEKVIHDEKVVFDPHPRPAADLPIRLYRHCSSI